ncbi:MAG: hypothetical protein LLF92_08250 [Planctomycetaceae bacterium]|nr:hypothetical protein [Planctomycetaceae bacterium]
MGFAEIKDNLFKMESPDAGKNKKMLMLMPVLFIIMIFVVTRALKQPAASSAAVDTSAKTATESNSVKINWKIPEVYPTNLRDPMQEGSATAGEDKSGSVVIKGIIYSKDKPAVLIDDKIMHEGDKVAGATIVKINSKNVEFEKNDKTWTQEVQH